MTDSEHVSSDAPSTAKCAVPSAIAGRPPDPTTPYEADLAGAGAHGPAARATETGVPAADETDVEPSVHLPQIPGYQVQRTIGGGGMGTVFKAVHLGLNRVVALKLINAGWVADDDFRARFDREAKTLAALEHANIVPVFDAGTWQGLPYLTMKFVSGKTLYHRLEVVRRDLRKAARLMAQVCRAVQYLHSKGIIHRDLKPLNILLTADGTPLVADFGLARPLADDSAMSMTMVPLGTRQYMSPEQSRGGRENYTPACDVWALGVILYELLAGHRPFGHDDPVELFQQIRCEPAPPIPANQNAPPELEVIARKCLEKSPADRYPTAEAVAADLECWLEGKPISVPLPAHAPPEAPVEPPAPVSVQKPRRSRVLMGGLGAVVVTAAGLIAAAVAGAFDKPRATARGDEEGAPAVPERTLRERFDAGEPIALTDPKGKPIGAATTFPGHHFGEGPTEDGYHEYFATTTGLVELSAEPFPFPLRVTAEVAVRHVPQEPPKKQEPPEKKETPLDSVIGVYVGRRDWADGPVPHRSLIWFGFRDKFPPKPAEPQRLCLRGLYWWERNVESGVTDSDNKPSPLKRVDGTSDGPLFSRVEIVVHDATITARLNGVDLEPVTAKKLAVDLRRKILQRPHIGDYLFNPPLFGSGIGIYLCNAKGIVADLTVSKFNPKP